MKCANKSVNNIYCDKHENINIKETKKTMEQNCTLD
jgi:hypothetical protein